KLFQSSSLNQIAPYIGIKELAQFPDTLEQMVARLNQKNYNKLEFEFLDPTADESLEADAKRYKIMAVKWPALDNGTIPPGNGAIGMVMKFGGQAIVVPLLQVIKIPIIGTQYKLMTSAELEEHINRNVEALININQDLGFIEGHGTLDMGGASPAGQNIRQNPDAVLNFRTLISQNYTLKPVDVGQAIIPDNLNAIVIARPTEPFSDYALFQIDQFLMKGKNLILFLDRFREVQPANQQGRSLGGQQTVFVPLATGLEKLLNHYGIRIKQSYVMDENCYKQEVPPQLGGGQQAVYYAPIIKNRFINKELNFMKNIKGMITLKISPLELDTERLDAHTLKAIRLISSSENSWEMSGRITLNPMFIQPPQSKEEMQSKALAYVVTGKFPSYFADKPIPVKKVDETAARETDSQEDRQQEQNQLSTQQSTVDLSKITASGQFLPEGKPAKIFLMASSDMLRDNLLDAVGRGPNATYILNVIDYLNGREDVAVMRAKQQRFNPLDDAAASTRTFVKTMNIVGLPALVVVFGIAVWFRRHRRKKNIQMMFQK
ncbi:MAG: GldG family protein, partial [Deltaproteobacteria bacterium]|nr:GldG family protein [Deltaproteobacteria bacterium]